MIVIDNEVVFEAIDGAEMYIHPVPCDLLELLGIDLVVENLPLALVDYLLAHLLTLLSHLLLCVEVNGELVPGQAL